ncbi:MAG: MFS transporter [Dehalococcoidia bacterium]|nr:MAG: MFS transporter [Dehalococcoidia bacterium]
MAIEARGVDPATATAPLITPPQADRAVAQGNGRFATFRSLRHRNYRLIWIGTLFSSSGQWIQQTSLGWLTYDMTGSAFLLGAVNGFRSLPLLVLGPVGGVAADRYDKKKLMLTTQMFMVAISVVFATLIVTGHVHVWHIFAFTLLSGVGWAFNMPVRQSIVPNLVPREDMMNAMALNSAAFNVTRIVGPTLAGIMIAKMGPGENFFVQSAMYIGVSITIVQLALPKFQTATNRSMRGGLAEGAKYVWHHPTLRTQMTMALVPVVIALPYVSLLPIVAKENLGKGAGGFGVLMSAPGIGAVASTLLLATLGDIQRKGLLLMAAIFAFGITLMAFAASVSIVNSYPLAIVLLVVAGACQMVFMTTNQTVMQLTTPDEFRGRVMGIFMLNQGLLPLGSLFGGTLAQFTNAQTALGVMGLSVTLLAVAFGLFAKSVRTL